MTCVVAYTDGKKVYMGSDKLAASSDFKTESNNKKIFKRNNMVIGMAGSYRMIQHVMYLFKLPSPPPFKNVNDCEKWMVKTFAMKLKEEIDNNWLENDEDHYSSFEMLVGVRGYLWTVQEDFSVLNYGHPYATVGSGSTFALGSLHQQFHNDEVILKTKSEIEDFLCDAVHTAHCFHPSVGSQFDFIG